MKEQIDKWLELTKEYFNIPYFKSYSKERTQFKARAVAMCFLSHKLDLTQVEIAKMFGIKNRCSVSYSINYAVTHCRQQMKDIEDKVDGKMQETLF